MLRKYAYSLSYKCQFSFKYEDVQRESFHLADLTTGWFCQYSQYINCTQVSCKLASNRHTDHIYGPPFPRSFCNLPPFYKPFSLISVILWNKFIRPWDLCKVFAQVQVPCVVCVLTSAKLLAGALCLTFRHESSVELLMEQNGSKYKCISQNYSFKRLEWGLKWAQLNKGLIFTCCSFNWIPYFVF